MSALEPNIRIPVDVTNPGQFFACCGLLELASRLDGSAMGWFDGREFCLFSASEFDFATLIEAIRSSHVLNTMTPMEVARLEVLRKGYEHTSELEEEKKQLESLRRESPILLNGFDSIRMDWFHDDLSGGARFKTWAGQQSVLDIAQSMHCGLSSIDDLDESSLWSYVSGIGLPFNFDSDLGGQGSALDIGFSFDPLSGSEITRIEGSSKPVLEFLCFIGLQRFRPREINGENRFQYFVWVEPFSPAIAAVVVSGAIRQQSAACYEFRLLYRTKYLKSFLPAQPHQGNHDE